MILLFNGYSLEFYKVRNIYSVWYYLKQINIKSLKAVGFVRKNVETIVHIFSCGIISTLWSELSSYLRKTSERIGCNVLNIIFGELLLACRNKSINFSILSMKQYLFFDDE